MAVPYSKPEEETDEEREDKEQKIECRWGGTLNQNRGEATDHNEGVRRNIWTFDRGGRQAKDIKERILKRQTKNQTDQTRKKQALMARLQSSVLLKA